MDNPNPPLSDHGNLEDDREEASNEGRHTKLEKVRISSSMRSSRVPEAEEGDKEDDKRVVDGRDDPQHEVFVSESSFSGCRNGNKADSNKQMKWKS